MTEKPEFIAGLKNAVERGYSLELAIQSFVNSGYNRQDVLDSARTIDNSIISKIPFNPLEFLPKQQNQPAIQPRIQPQLQPQQIQVRQTQQPAIQQQIAQAEKKKSKLGWIILLSGLLIILLGVLIGFIFFKDNIISLLTKLGF